MSPLYAFRYTTRIFPALRLSTPFSILLISIFGQLRNPFSASTTLLIQYPPSPPQYTHVLTAFPTNSSSTLAPQIYSNPCIVSLKSRPLIPAPTPPSLSLKKTSLLGMRKAHAKGTIDRLASATSVMGYQVPDSLSTLYRPPYSASLFLTIDRCEA